MPSRRRVEYRTQKCRASSMRLCAWLVQITRHNQLAISQSKTYVCSLISSTPLIPGRIVSNPYYFIWRPYLIWNYCHVLFRKYRKKQKQTYKPNSSLRMACQTAKAENKYYINITLLSRIKIEISNVKSWLLYWRENKFIHIFKYRNITHAR